MKDLIHIGFISSHQDRPCPYWIRLFPKWKPLFILNLSPLTMTDLIDTSCGSLLIYLMPYGRFQLQSMRKKCTEDIFNSSPGSISNFIYNGYHEHVDHLSLSLFLSHSDPRKIGKDASFILYWNAVRKKCLLVINKETDSNIVFLKVH